jgi:hypothetical protein
MVAQNTWYSPQEMFGNTKPSDMCSLTFLPFWEINYRDCLKGYYAAVLHPTQKLPRMPHVILAPYTQPCAHFSNSRTAILSPRFIGNECRMHGNIGHSQKILGKIGEVHTLANQPTNSMEQSPS